MSRCKHHDFYTKEHSALTYCRNCSEEFSPDESFIVVQEHELEDLRSKLSAAEERARVARLETLDRVCARLAEVAYEWRGHGGHMHTSICADLLDKLIPELHNLTAQPQEPPQ